MEKEEKNILCIEFVYTRKSEKVSLTFSNWQGKSDQEKIVDSVLDVLLDDVDALCRKINSKRVVDIPQFAGLAQKEFLLCLIISSPRV
jgi:hypothetical protein